MRRRIIALALAATLAVGGGAAYAWESRLTDEDVPFVGYPTAQEVSSWQLMRGQYERSAERGESVAPVFGSSELNPGPAGFSHPGNLLAPGTYDVGALMAAARVVRTCGRQSRSVPLPQWRMPRAAWCFSRASNGS